MNSSNAYPLVSCIMPTFNRRVFVEMAIRYFLRQNYPCAELIIVDDGADQVGDLAQVDERIRYMRLDRRMSVGAKRNLACEHARGEMVAHWDDDDWYAPSRLRYQVEALLRAPARAVCGINHLTFYDIQQARAWCYTYPADQRVWLSGNTLCYTRAFWLGNHFADIDIGEDAYFVWNGQPDQVIALPDTTFHVGIIHPNNVSPKQTDGVWWQPYPVDKVQRVLGDDWVRYQPGTIEMPRQLRPSTISVQQQDIPPIRNIFACLVHENQECVIDLVRNLRYLDPSSVILLYNGGTNHHLLDRHFPFDQYGVVLHPHPQPMAWGRLHDFALDCMRFALEHIPFDTLTIVDSDQLCVQSGYSCYLAQFLAMHPGIGLLGNAPEPQPPNTQVGPAIAAFQEIDLWRPFLRRIPDGEQKFAHWTFWPSTVFTAGAARDLIKLFDTDSQWQDIMRRSKIWATEEIIFPTLVALLGYKIGANPCSYEYVKYRESYTQRQIDIAMSRSNVFWVHPVPRRYEDGLRKHIRSRLNHYEKGFGSGGNMTRSETSRVPALLLTQPILRLMSGVEGWLEEDEADLLIAASQAALAEHAHSLVEVGSYCGRATVVLGSVVKTIRPEARVYAIDPHDGKVGALDQHIIVGQPTLEKLKRTLATADLLGCVEIIQSRSTEVSWEKPISLLLIDGLHDYASVARDFFHFEAWVVPGGYIAFHDYADYFPGVKTFVNEVLDSGKYRKIHCAHTMVLIQKQPVAALLDEDGSWTLLLSESLDSTQETISDTSTPLVLQSMVTA